MAKIDQSDLQKLALELARNVAGQENVDRVEVEPGLSWDGNLAYRFRVFIDPSLSSDKLGSLQIDMLMGLRDALDERGIDDEAYVSLMDSRRARAEAPSAA